jgi:hypothetical protein
MPPRVAGAEGDECLMEARGGQGCVPAGTRHSDGVRPMRRWLISAVGVILTAAVGLAPATAAAAPGDGNHHRDKLGGPGARLTDPRLPTARAA